MRTLSFLLWTTCSVALGIWLATVPVGGRTPWEHVKHVWAESGVSLPSLSMLHGPAKAAAAEGRAAPKIAERHTEQERDALNRLITHRGEK